MITQSDWRGTEEKDADTATPIGASVLPCLCWNIMVIPVQDDDECRCDDGASTDRATLIPWPAFSCPPYLFWTRRASVPQASLLFAAPLSPTTHPIVSSHPPHPPPIPSHSPFAASKSINVCVVPTPFFPCRVVVFFRFGYAKGRRGRGRENRQLPLLRLQQASKLAAELPRSTPVA